ncbi:MAG: ribonuclease E [Gammaproteobacteria bacterium]|nr:MAG: ribonuclease E [Gammaproteobacteria bacterium]
MFIFNVIRGLFRFIRRNLRTIIKIKILLFTIIIIIFAAGKTYQRWDDDPDRGAVAIDDGAFGESYSTPTYLDQGWSESDSLWFYNTTQGSGLLPYDFFLALEQADSKELFRTNNNMDKFRYLPQKTTFFNPDGLAVGFVKDTYAGRDYVGFTCAACHTGQVNYKGQAMRIDGGSAMADMVGFLKEMEKSLEQTRTDAQKRDRFVKSVLDFDNDYSNSEEVIKDLKKWGDTIKLYNTVNHSHLDYGYARLDAFGRIYNRVLEHMINKSQLRLAYLQVTTADDRRLLTPEQVDAVLEGVSETIIGDSHFSLIEERLASKEGKYPGLNEEDRQRLRNAIFNEADAPVSYPFLWDIAHSDYVQWNGLADNAGIGPLARNAGEVLGVFSVLDWTAHESGFNFSAWITGEKSKKRTINFKSSIDLTNLSRLESHLNSLQSPQWPEKILGKINSEQVNRGEIIYNEYCAACHQVVERDNWDRLVVSNMSSLDVVGTDPLMAKNSVNYTGYAGNFESIYQPTGVGALIVQKRAPVVQVLTAATMGTLATPDPDKWVIRRFADWVYMLGKSFFDNDIKASVKSGNYKPDTTATPYESLLAYKARSLNGIWATAPFLHNGSVPNLWSLLLPVEERPKVFCVGNREFDPVNVGFSTEGCDKSSSTDKRRFSVEPNGNLNIGHEYGVGKDEKDKLTEQERWDLIEYIKTL